MPKREFEVSGDIEAANVKAHLEATENPHAVTPEQIGAATTGGVDSFVQKLEVLYWMGVR